MNLDEAIQRHAEWKVKFRSAIAKRERMDVDTISVDNRCALGQWLHGEGRARHGARPEFAVVVQRHKAFHIEAGKVARLINLGQYDQAEQALGNGTPFSQASMEVGTAILQLKKAAA